MSGAKGQKTAGERSGWQTSRRERINYYIGDLGRTLEGYIVTAFMTLFLLFQGIDLVRISAAILIVKIIDACYKSIIEPTSYTAVFPSNIISCIMICLVINNFFRY